jgi:alpha-galactosidase
LNHVHSLGLKLGLYGDSGILTCGFRPGSWGYEERDARTLAGWGVDHWKYGNCGEFQAMTHTPQERFRTMMQGGRSFIRFTSGGFSFRGTWGGK